MSDEAITHALATHLANPEAAEVLRAYEASEQAGAIPTIALFTSAMMRRWGRNIAMLEGKGEHLRILYAGAEVPGADGDSLTGRPICSFEPTSAAFYFKGAQAAQGRDAAILLRHRDTFEASIHRWEGLFLPLAEQQGGARTLVAALCMPLVSKHAFFRDLIDAIPQAAIVVEPCATPGPLKQGVIRAANQSALHLLGQPDLSSLLGQALSDAFAQPDVEGAWQALAGQMRTGMSAHFEYNHRAENSGRWFDVSLAPLGTDVILTLTDITDLKRAILELEHQRKMLVEEMEQRRSLEEELWALAHLDPLTGLPNRRAFRDHAQSTLITAQTLEHPCAIISIDIDHFKRVNDTHGHGAGDIVLRRVADILKAPLRPEVDIAARLGGEEFTVLLPDTELDGARAFAEMLRHRVEHTVVIVGEAEIRPTISLGVAMVTPEGDLDNLIDRSDRALYAAKHAGRNCVLAEGDAPLVEMQQEKAA